MRIARAFASIIAVLAIAGISAGNANADVTTSNDAQDQATTSEGTSNDAVDHMANDGPGIVHTPHPVHYEIVGYVPMLDIDGNQIYDDEGNPKYMPVGEFLPVPTPNVLVIFHP